jgi:hypothetical protein
MLQWRITKCYQSATDLRVMAIKSYHILAHGYQALCKGGLVYQVTTVIRAMKHDVLIPFFPDVLTEASTWLRLLTIATAHIATGVHARSTGNLYYLKIEGAVPRRTTR